jgi:hypothetical protein
LRTFRLLRRHRCGVGEQPFKKVFHTRWFIEMV